MCGIAGVLSLGAELGPDDREEVERMLSAISHRGPDGRGIVVKPGAILGNARLRITDLGDQADLPMSDESGDLCLSYNGAVTNFHELRAGLLKAGRRLRTRSDAEPLLHLYQDSGIDCLRDLTGMFALCLYDGPRRKAFLARDFFGQRPLFYMRKNGRLYFASELKSFFELAAFDKRLDLDGLHHFFSLAYIPGTRTPFESVRELEGGRLLEVDLAAGTASEREFYRLDFRPDEALSESEAASRIRDALRDSLLRNLQADVPVGLALSGGVDTGILLGLLKELGRSRRVHTFSVRMKSPSFDESRYQKLLVDFAKPIHHEVAVGPEEVSGNLLRQVAYADEPSGDGAAIPFLLLARGAKDHVSVLLSGEGGDEIFNAYETHRACQARRLYRRWVPAALRAALRAAAAALPVAHSKLSFDFVLKRFLEGAELGVPEAHCFWRHALKPGDQRRLLAPLGRRLPTEKLFRELFDSLPFAEDLDRISFIDLRYYFKDDLMVKNDRMLMANSIEGRYPYMDRLLVEQAARIPLRYKIRGLRGRLVQKKAAEGLVPPDILRRSNMGLEMPHSAWFLRELKGIGDRYFAPKNVAKSGLIDPSVVQELWQGHLGRRADHGRALWCILNFLVWFDLFIYDGDYKKYWVAEGRGAPSMR